MAKGIVQNRDFITDHIRRHQPVSRYRIAREFEMNPSTVGNIVDGLLEEGLVIETDESRESVSAGRPPILLRVNPDAGHFIGIDVYRNRVTGVVTDFSGQTTAAWGVDLASEPHREAVLDRVVDTVLSLQRETGLRERSFRAIGVGLPGLVDRASGMALHYRLITDWHDVPIRAILRERFGVPVFVEHNSNTVALGEACLGDAAAHEHVVAVLLRAGVSIGVVRHREITAQSSLGPGELGHTVVHVDGRRCWCGNRGCLEAYASGWRLEHDVRRQIRRDPAWPGREAFPDPVGRFDAAAICRLAIAGDDTSAAMLRGIFRHLGVGVMNVVRLLAPEAVIISGSFNEAGPLLAAEVKQVLSRPLEHPIRIPEIIISSQDDRIGAAGAALMAASMVCNPIHRVPA